MFKVGEKVYLTDDIEDFKEGTEAIIKEVKSDELILEIDNDEVTAEYRDVLKSCHCGCDPNLIIRPDKYVKVHCFTCGNNVKVNVNAYYTAVDKAIEYWNKRV